MELWEINSVSAFFYRYFDFRCQQKFKPLHKLLFARKKIMCQSECIDILNLPHRKSGHCNGMAYSGGLTVDRRALNHCR